MKRCLDIISAALGVLLLSPLLLLTALLIRWRLGAPVLFRQQRLGRGAEIFSLFKFRTMTSEVDGEGRLLPDHLRLTPLGRFLRKTSIDELPELINVLRGEMSLVGPRPLLPRYLPYFTEAEKVRFEVRPGITGWAQIHGRNLLCWAKRFELDTWYVRHRSLFLDLRILYRTLAVVLTRRGAEVDPGRIMLDLDQERAGRDNNPTWRSTGEPGG
ncbi:putative sugar transferase EpsL [Desulfuromonas versatilis]|uniref:Sugar transferase EpsL n=1 Tax=Desulfuromonas versatilis TaxID=2802975 RepID=A0ABN6E0E5_9BACT|nr:sugar transferase [Desulfuromonas versatilis]BCR05790.1 putative sugar transferase EpsL [Desulfuromonas versatilis]